MMDITNLSDASLKAYAAIQKHLRQPFDAHVNDSYVYILHTQYERTYRLYFVYRGG